MVPEIQQAKPGTLLRRAPLSEIQAQVPGSQVPHVCLLWAPPHPVSTPQSRQSSWVSLPNLYRAAGGGPDWAFLSSFHYLF